MSPRPLGRLVRYLALLALSCLAAQAMVVSSDSGNNGNSDSTTKEWLNRSEVVRQFPITTQKAVFVNLLKSKNVDLTGDVPDSLDNELPDMVESLVNGAIDTFLADVPFVGKILNSLVSGGIKYLKSIFGGRKVYIPDMPPLVSCPGNIVKNQDKGRLSSLVSWQEPVGYDIEDGVLGVQRRGKAPGSRFSGEEIVQYETVDKNGGSDFCMFTITINIVKCPLIPLMTNRINTCQGISYYGDTCDFSCKEGYTLQGQPRLECMGDRRFNWPAPTCDINKCPSPPLPEGGKDWSCSNGYKYNSVCTINCADGYRNVRTHDRTPWDQATIKCLSNGTWTRMPVCKDVTAPVITNCPGYTRVYADRSMRSALVVWPTIQAHDSTGKKSVTVRQILGDPSGSRFNEGATEISYEAVDDAGLKDICTFYINVDVLHCNVPMTTSNIMEIDCPSQFMYGAACTISCLHQIQLEGSKRITCERIGDKMEWQYPLGPPKCLEKECPALPQIENAEFYCTPFSSSKICTLDCLPGFIPGRNSNGSSTTCAISTGAWTKTYFAGCVKKREPTGVQKKLRMYWRSNCLGSTENRNLANVEDIMTPILNKVMFFQSCTDCRITNIHATCGNYRNRVVVHLSWAIEHAFNAPEPILKGKLSGVAGAQEDWMQENLKNTGGLQWQPNKERTVRFIDRGDSAICPSTMSPSPGLLSCAACGPGTIAVADGCQPCPENTYQDDSQDGSTCIPCPEGTTTIGIGKGHARDCKRPCPKGTDSETGLTPCRDCSIGEYNDMEGQTACKLCPHGQYTPTPGSMSSSDCYSPASQVIRFQVANYGTDFARLTWFRPDVINGEHRGYVIEYRERSTPDVMKAVIENTRTEIYEINNLKPNTDYKFTIYAMNEFGPGVPRTLDLTTEEVTTTTTTTTTTAPTTEDMNCPAGTSSFNGLKTAQGGCHKCPIGFYQPLTGQTGCKVCPAGHTTWYTGSVAASDCVDETWTTPTTTTLTTTQVTTGPPGTPCPSYHASATGFEPGCKRCATNMMPNTARTACQWCPYDIKTSTFQCL